VDARGAFGEEISDDATTIDVFPPTAHRVAKISANSGSLKSVEMGRVP
jgi:hypothetical protein